MRITQERVTILLSAFQSWDWPSSPPNHLPVPICSFIAVDCCHFHLKDSWLINGNLQPGLSGPSPSPALPVPASSPLEWYRVWGSLASQSSLCQKLEMKNYRWQHKDVGYEDEGEWWNWRQGKLSPRCLESGEVIVNTTLYTEQHSSCVKWNKLLSALHGWDTHQTAENWVCLYPETRLP